MILAFEFNYISKNALLENILESICKDFDIFYKIGKVGNIVNLYVEGDETKLTNFSDFIGKRLPLSIFFKSTAVNVVDEIKDDLETIDECKLCLPFTPKSLFTCKDKNDSMYLNPLINNEVGIKTFVAKGVLLKENDNVIVDAKETSNFEALYNEIAKIINSRDEVYINSTSGSYVIGKIDSKFKKDGSFTVIPTDLSVVEKMVVSRENEIKALASLEKPTIKFRVNTLYGAKEILPTQRVKMKLADELLMQNICERLFSNGIEFLYKIDTKASTCKYSLEIDGSFELLPQIEICVLENGEILIISGDGYSNPVLKENMKKLDNKEHAQFASIMQEHNLFDDKVSCFYLSKTHDDAIMHFSEKTGMLDLIRFPIVKDISKIFEIIFKDSDIGERLVRSYQEKFPQIYKTATNCTISQDASNSMHSIWGITAVILGMSDNIEDGSKKLIENAEDFGGQKGPRIDYLLVDKEAIKSDFDMIRLIRSAMSFKLADTDDVTLSFGIMEALAYFLSDTSDSCRENLSSEKTLLCGSMFGIRKFAELASKNISASSQICLNRELPIDTL
jgi:hypothetical protein